MTEQKNQPYLTVRDRTLSISIFKKRVIDKTTNEDKDTYGACLQRSYKTKEGEWKREQINLFPDEILNISALCSRAYNDLTAKIQQDRENDKANRPNSFLAQNMDTPEPPAYLNDDIPF